MSRVYPTRNYFERFVIQAFSILLYVCLFVLHALAQQRPDISNRQQRLSVPVYDTAQGTSVLLFHVFVEKNGARLDRQARLELTNVDRHSGVFVTIEGDQDGVFRDITLWEV